MKRERREVEGEDKEEEGKESKRKKEIEKEKGKEKKRMLLLCKSTQPWLRCCLERDKLTKHLEVNEERQTSDS